MSVFLTVLRWLARLSGLLVAGGMRKPELSEPTLGMRPFPARARARAGGGTGQARRSRVLLA